MHVTCHMSLDILNAYDLFKNLTLKKFLTLACSSSTEAAVKPALPATRRRSQVARPLSQRHAAADEGE